MRTLSFSCGLPLKMQFSMLKGKFRPIYATRSVQCLGSSAIRILRDEATPLIGLGWEVHSASSATYHFLTSLR